MAKSKPTRKGTRRPKRGRGKKAAGLTWKVLGAIAAVALLVFGAVALMRVWAPPERRIAGPEHPKSAAKEPYVAARARPPERRPEARPAPGRPAGPKPPIYEVFPEKPPAPPSAEPDTLHAALPPAPPELPPLKKRPRLAIIIDDLGYDRQLAEKLIGLNAPLTVAILPNSPHQVAIARLAHERGLEVMLHLPMEPVEYPEINPGPGALLASMGPDDLLLTLEKNLKAVPHTQGVNNHMGSRLTASSEPMYQVFSVLKRHGLYFVDSRTTDESVCRPSARLFQLPFAQRDVFLDHAHDLTSIRKQLRELVRVAQRKGEAVGIAHPHPNTYQVLREELPALQQQVEIVPASRLVRVID
ncbi:MAG: divergent polysaccharide deacetylase family protein [Desulfobacterales bacterium]